MSSQTYRYRPSAIAIISLREFAASFVPQIPIVLMFACAPAVASRDARYFIGFFELTLPWLVAFAVLYCLWRGYSLYSSRIEFDGTELIWRTRKDQRGLLSREVVGCLNTRRILHITSGRPEYTITIHSELDGFGELSQKLQRWFPESRQRLPAKPTQVLKPFLRNVAWCVPYTLLAYLTPGMLDPLFRMLSPDEIHYFAMLLPVLLAGAMAFVIRRSILKHPPRITAATEPPAFYIVQ